MKKSTTNFTIDILMFLCMSAIIGIGFLIKFTLIPGQERWIVYGKNVELYLFGMERHEWGTIHLIIGFILLGLLVLHIILHGNTITCVYRRIIKRKDVRNIIAVIFIFISVLMIIIPFFIKPKIEEIGQGKGRQIIINNSQHYRKEVNTITTYKTEKINNIELVKTHGHNTLKPEIRGYMTINEVSNKFNVPSNFIKKKLKIPVSISDKQKLGWLRKNYDFKMSKIEKIINEYRKKNK